MKKLFTSESVTCGHPDKMCDQIADAILDAHLKEDENSRVACEVCVSRNLVLIVGEITSNAIIDIEKIVRKVIVEIGYDNDELEFNGNNCKIIQNISRQSSDIALGVDKSFEEKEHLLCNELGAGDQGLMFGYACRENYNYMPLAISLAHELARRLEIVRKDGTLSYLRPDGKTQVTVEYENDIPQRIDTIVISCQHKPNIDMVKLKSDIKHNVIEKIISNNLIDEKTKFFINPTGQFAIGGPAGDSGLTGRKIIVDTYGGYGHHGGGSFSGKDYTKVDRTACYYARYVAKNIVATGLADKCEIQVSYAIGVATPVSIYIDTFNTAKVPESKILEAINYIFDFKPSSMIKSLKLKRPIYQSCATYGHFGREDLKVSWELLDKVTQVSNYINDKIN